MLGIQNGMRQQPNQQPNKIKMQHKIQTNNPGVRSTRVTIVKWH
jgi:hypothetical protein